MPAISALASTVNSGGYMWHREKAASPQRVRPPSPECAAKPPPPMPVSHICEPTLAQVLTQHVRAHDQRHGTTQGLRHSSERLGAVRVN